ncbi:ABC transporter ATP-binding protein [Rhizobacter fulvus]|jgi:glycerol transport system ATP-binding protein
MELKLERVEQKVGASTWLYPLDLTLVPRAVTVLLGATQAGKTTLMRVMAGLDAPSKGRVLADGVDVTGQPVRQRNVAMVYQQFINYPSLTVADNIASPLKLRKEANVDARVAELAAKLHIEPFLQRLPAELSGGQQQRVALARALAKNAPLMLLDEPLVNLDYKLREELRDELSQLFATGQSTVVYATTEPTEALLLGGYTAVLDAGELLQYGPTAEVFHHPKSIRVARAFSDPPMNLIQGTANADGVALPGGVQLGRSLPAGAAAALTVGVRAAALRVHGRDGDIALPGKVELAEISGSDTFVHVATPVGELVAQLTGVHQFELGAQVTLYLAPAQAYVFGADGQLLVAPQGI